MKYYILSTLFVIFSTLSLNKISKDEAYQQPQFKQALQQSIYTTISSKNLSVAPVVYELTISANESLPPKMVKVNQMKTYLHSCFNLLCLSMFATK